MAKEQASFLAGVTSVAAANKINSAIFFGETGTGKTWLAASADAIEDYSPVLLVDIEGSAAGVDRKYPGVQRIVVNTYQELELLRDELLNKEHPFKTVLFDTLNVAQNRAFKVFKAANPNNKFGAYDDLKEWTLDFVREMHAAPFMAIFLAHPQVDKDENSGKMSTTVKLIGSSRTDVPTVTDIVGYMGYDELDDGTLVRTLQVGRSTSIVTKNRFGLPDKIWPDKGEEGPTIFTIQRAMLEAQDKDK